MKTRSLFLTIAAGLIVSGIGPLDARAGSLVPLPTKLTNLLVSGAYTTVDGGELDVLPVHLFFFLESATGSRRTASFDTLWSTRSRWGRDRLFSERYSKRGSGHVRRRLDYLRRDGARGSIDQRRCPDHHWRWQRFLPGQ